MFLFFYFKSKKYKRKYVCTSKYNQGTDTDLPVSKTSFYNALDYLFDNKEQILKNVNNQLVSENKRKLQVLWYDTTTAYFESFSRVGIRLPGFFLRWKI
ncbi:hypothetical protein [Mycoplasmopsis anatis]|uniref:hypothetical protein n=1 Tax=Mycoplasmopsis anatis TaxID=171279 RepID=UPI003F875E72